MVSSPRAVVVSVASSKELCGLSLSVLESETEVDRSELLPGDDLVAPLGDGLAPPWLISWTTSPSR
jgi:hypothetical protein